MPIGYNVIMQSLNSGHQLRFKLSFQEPFVSVCGERKLDRLISTHSPEHLESSLEQMIGFLQRNERYPWLPTNAW